ncbi:putative emp24 gp25L p24 family GOLD [Trypanosoma vivax]|uniref:GOLD domain-containing protein n=1 Tax=Trypanosoma vivax (strain Y486) TaxID=1055687 RepID=G0TZU4_TRYVY|nr:hypothetical protein TRVL_01472 [Trypanosoma vivax]KAH8617618.1 putative emp24 gp25L p24 family GOLD [Trypanosoma vivax]CCC50122.1 conserved hypothetical protein [Trypanosoma vivax Y486]
MRRLAKNDSNAEFVSARGYRATTLWLLASALVTLCRATSGAQVVLQHRERFCLRDAVPQHSRVIFQFFTIGANMPKVHTTVTDQNEKELMRWDDVNTGVYEGRAKDGITLLVACFDNSGPRKEKKRISFNLRLHVDQESVASGAAMDPIELYVERIASRVRDVEVLQRNMRQLQKVHIATVESTENWLTLWGVSQVVALIAVALLQLYFLKRLLVRNSAV